MVEAGKDNIQWPFVKLCKEIDIYHDTSFVIKIVWRLTILLIEFVPTPKSDYPTSTKTLRWQATCKELEIHLLLTPQTFVPSELG